VDDADSERDEGDEADDDDDDDDDGGGGGVNGDGGGGGGGGGGGRRRNTGQMKTDKSPMRLLDPGVTPSRSSHSPAVTRPTYIAGVKTSSDSDDVSVNEAVMMRRPNDELRHVPVHDVSHVETPSAEDSYVRQSNSDRTRCPKADVVTHHQQVT